MKKENENILSKLRKEFNSFGENYKPDSRKAAEMYAQYAPSQNQYDFISLSGRPESSYSTQGGVTTKVIGEAEENRTHVQNEFLKSISTGDRKQAIQIALNADKNNIGIPLSYFNDMLDRDRLMRLAYEQDNPAISEPAIRPSSYNAAPGATPSKPGFEMAPRPEFASMENLSKSSSLRKYLEENKSQNTVIR